LKQNAFDDVVVLLSSVLESDEFLGCTGVLFNLGYGRLAIHAYSGVDRSARRDRVFVGRFLSYDLGSPLVRGGIAVAVKYLCGVIAKERVDIGTAVASI
jgi:hypothetical protein